MVILDTDVLIYFLKGNKKVVRNVEKLFLTNTIAIQILSLAELYEGFYSQPEICETKLQKFEEFLKKHVTIVNLDDEICKRFGELRGVLRKKNKLIDNFDLIIGVSCLVHESVLYTKNTKHFEKIPGLNLYREFL